MLPSKCRSLFDVFLAHVIFINCILTLSVCNAEETAKKQQGTSALTAEQRERVMLEASIKPFFNITNDFLDVVQQKSFSGRVVMDFVNQIQQPKQRGFMDYIALISPVVTTYPGYVALLLFGILLFLLIPIIGLFWCTCRCCCHKCGARAKPMDGKYARCRRGTFAVTLGILCTLVLAGSVLAFISNDLLHRPFLTKSTDNPVTVMNTSLVGIAEHMHNTLRSFNNETQALLSKQVSTVTRAVQEAGTKAQADLIKLSKIKEILVLWSGAKSDIENLRVIGQSLRSNTTEFINDVDNFTNTLPILTDRLLKSLNDCTTVECSNAEDALKNLSLSYNTSSLKLSIVNETVEFLENINLTTISTYLDNANITLHNVSARINEIGAAEINNVVANLNDSKKIEAYFRKSEEFIKMITDQIRAITNLFNNFTFPGNKKMRPFLAQMDEYRMYGFIGVGSTILLIVFFYYLGLCFGACGEPPYEDARLCNRGVGATLMSCGVGFTFLFFPIVILIVMGTFMVGAPMRTEVCRYLLGERPNGFSTLDTEISSVLTDLNMTIAGYRYPPNFTYHIMGDCKTNTSLITAFGLDGLVNGSKLYETEVRPSLQKLETKIEKMDLHIDLESVIKLARDYSDLILTKDLVVKLKEAQDNLQKEILPNFSSVVGLLIDADQSYNNSLDVNSTIETINDLIRTTNASKNRVIASIEAMKPLINVKNYMNQLRVSAEDLNKKVAKNSADMKSIIRGAYTLLDTAVRQILINAVNTVLSEYASCRVVHDKVVVIVNLVCRTLLNPFNGFWVGIGWSLLILIPSMIFACKLNYLYRKTEYYVKDYEEPDYMSYQGFYPSDNIPLERKSRGKNKQAKGRTRSGHKSRSGASGGILRHTGPPDPLPYGPGCGPSASGSMGGMNRRGWQHPYTKLPVYPRDAYD